MQFVLYFVPSIFRRSKFFENSFGPDNVVLCVRHVIDVNELCFLNFSSIITISIVDFVSSFSCFILQ